MSDTTGGGSQHWFHFAIPRNATRESRESAPAYIEQTYGISGRIEHVSTDPKFQLYRMEYYA